MDEFSPGPPTRASGEHGKRDLNCVGVRMAFEQVGGGKICETGNQPTIEKYGSQRFPYRCVQQASVVSWGVTAVDEDASTL
jgi:hypothetical protein